MTSNSSAVRREVVAAETLEEIVQLARDFLDSVVTSDGRATNTDRSVGIIEETVERDSQLVSVARQFQRTLFDAGLSWLAGPPELGGGGRPASWQVAIDELVSEWAVPSRAPLLIGLDIIAPAIAAHGSDDLQRRFLPGIHSGEIAGCQLFSEPGSGSDLAAARCVAVRDGDEWIVNGQKVWTSMAHVADVGELLARTDPTAGKHAGLSMLLVDMHAPGVSVRPLRQMTGGAAFNEVFLDNVRVPATDIVGAEGDGWKVAATSLNSERIAMMRGGSGPLTSAVLSRYAALAGDGGPEPELVGRAVASALAMGQISQRSEERGGRLAAVAGSLSKLALVDAIEQIDRSLPALLGVGLHLDDGVSDDWSPYTLGAPGLRLAGGTDEIHLNLVAQRGLGLPR